jgi:hypothetical protein
MEHRGVHYRVRDAGVAMVMESLLLLWIAWSRFGLATNNDALHLQLSPAALFCRLLGGTRPSRSHPAGPEDTNSKHRFPLSVL